MKLKILNPEYEIVKKGKIQLGDILFDTRVNSWLYGIEVTSETKHSNGKVLNDFVSKYPGVARKKV